MVNVPAHPRSTPRIVVVLVTYNRMNELEKCLRSIASQEVNISKIVLVDNSDIPLDKSSILSYYPSLLYLPQSTNTGPAGGLSIGISYARDLLDPDFIWITEDDSFYRRDFLRNSLQAFAHTDNCGIVGRRGATIKRGQWKPTATEKQESTSHPDNLKLLTDIVSLDGALLPIAVVKKVGVPLADYFIMVHDIEYPLRIKRFGFQVVEIEGKDTTSLGLGAAAASRRPSSRSFYQERNSLLLARSSKDPWFFYGFLKRLSLRCFFDLFLPFPFTRIRFRFLGVWDGLKGRTGITGRKFDV